MSAAVMTYSDKADLANSIASAAISLLRRPLLALRAPARHALELSLGARIDLRRVALRCDGPEFRIFVHDHVGAGWRTHDRWFARLLLLNGG